MWLVSVSVMLAVVQWASSAGGSPRLPTRRMPPLVCAPAADARPAAASSAAAHTMRHLRRDSGRAIPPPPSRGSVRTGAETLPCPAALVNGEQLEAASRSGAVVAVRAKRAGLFTLRLYRDVTC